MCGKRVDLVQSKGSPGHLLSQLPLSALLQRKTIAKRVKHENDLLFQRNIMLGSNNYRRRGPSQSEQLYTRGDLVAMLQYSTVFNLQSQDKRIE